MAHGPKFLARKEAEHRLYIKTKSDPIEQMIDRKFNGGEFKNPSEGVYEIDIISPVEPDVASEIVNRYTNGVDPWTSVFYKEEVTGTSKRRFFVFVTGEEI